MGSPFNKKAFTQKTKDRRDKLKDRLMPKVKGIKKPYWQREIDAIKEAKEFGRALVSPEKWAKKVQSDIGLGTSKDTAPATMLVARRKTPLQQ
jgi:hypothetical protein